MDLITLAATCIFACTPVTPKPIDGKQYQQWEERLQGSVRSTEPIPETEEKAVNSESQGTELPSWLQGTWQAHASTLLYVYDFKNGKNLVKKPSTVKLERRYVRGMSSARTKGADDRDNLDSNTVVKNGPGELKIRSQALVTCTRKTDREIIDIFIEESTVDYEEVDDGVVQVSVTVTDYSIDNIPRRQSKSFFIETRMQSKTVAGAQGAPSKGSDQATAHGVNGGLGAIIHRQFIEDVAHVGLGRGQGNE
ncbi:MAG: hypothetical protein KGS72_22680 [Cyanobacteria bacterium REEB67]|nr:hypothetical protein [Cyanobacteria bacterium REEB67]